MPTAQTCTITEETFGTIKKVKWVWIATDAGIVTTSAVAGLNPQTTNVYSGEIIRLVTIPAGTTSAPDDNYNVYVYDDDDTDVLMGGGATRDTANTEQVLGTSLGCVANDKLELGITAAGDANGGTVILYIR